jgi:RimJ/RimL family protein N-acetyltransferase
MKFYKALNKQEFSSGDYSIVPIRMEDRFAIMKWRNEQVYHLRQDKPLTEKDQEEYFQFVVANLFEQEKPKQILFSFLKEGVLIGYGGLVHINWIDRNAEISFIMDTTLEEDNFELNWIRFLNLLEEVAWSQLNLHKIYTYAFDLRSRLYDALEKAGFAIDAVLKEHCFFGSEFKKVKIHSKFNKGEELRYAEITDFQTTYGWANNSEVRKFSFNKNKITLKEHANWFFTTLENPKCEYYLLEVNGTPAGSIRFDIEEDEVAKISYLLDPNFTGKGLGTFLLKEGVKFLKKNRPSIRKVYGHVFKKNIGSIKIFEKLSFQEVSNYSSELKYEKII